MKTRIYLFLPLLLFALAACDVTDSSDDPVARRSPLMPAHEPGEEEIANNLSAPVIWGDQVALPLGWARGKERFRGSYFKVEGDGWFVQQDPMNKWQAESTLPSAAQAGFHGFTVSAVDWKSNLEARDQTLHQPVRVRIALYKDLDEPMVAYTMRAEDPTVPGCDRVWGTNGETYLTNTALVYSAGAQLVIQRLTKSRDDASLDVEWAGDRWVGDVEAPLFSQGIWEIPEEHGGFKAKVSRKGEVIYHFNWRPGTATSEPVEALYGDYRLTFVLQEDAPVRLNTRFGPQTSLVASDEHVAGATPRVTLLPEDDHTGGGTAALQWQDNLTYIDVRIGQGGGGH